MKVLLVIAHYYRAETESKHTSTEPGARETRALAVRQVIEAWRGHLGLAGMLNIERKIYEPVEGLEHGLDIAVLVRGGDHVLDRPFVEKHRLNVVDVATDNPLMLPFAARKLFVDARYAYDMFVYSEDDLRPADGLLLSKVAGFIDAFGWRRVVLPNRYEWNPLGPALKTFIDGDMKASVTEGYFKSLPDEPFLRLRTRARDVVFRRVANPHSGFFAINAQQLAYWAQQPHFEEFDCSFVDPLVSAATLGILKTFPIYKSIGRDTGWLEIQHLDRRFSTMTDARSGVSGQR